MDGRAYFRNKKVTLMGLGLLGRGIGDAKYLAEQGAELIVTDLKSEAELAPSLAQLKEFPDIKYTLGAHKLEDFQGRDLILKAAGVPLDSPSIAEAKKNKIPVRMSADLFAEISGVQCIGITGTRGKSTTTHLIATILEAGGKKVLLGGNVRGVSTLALLDEVAGGETAVLELDSWQCQGWGEAHMSPHIAVFTTFYPDHLNYYSSAALTTGKDPLDAYLADKANIFINQIETDTLILGSQAAPYVREKYQNEILADLVIAGEEDIPSDWTLQIPGEHNRYNAGLALMAARAVGIEEEASRVAIESFKGVPGRLELVREVGGVKIYNDNNSTTPEATIAGLRAVGTPGKQAVVLILGGDEKNLNMDKLLAEIPLWCSKVVLFKERGTDRIRDEVFALEAKDIGVYEEAGLEATVQRAIAVAQAGDTVLYSPAFSSFGKYFKNEYDRGDQFNALVAQI